MSRRLALTALAVVLAACATPSGAAVEECDTSWTGLEARIVTGGTGERQSVPIACMLAVDERRISIGFEMPPGPDCFELAGIDLDESADAVAVSLTVGVLDKVGGTCPVEPVRVVTEVDLQAPVADRTLLDGSR
jgi:hypothetical protein